MTNGCEDISSPCRLCLETRNQGDWRRIRGYLKSYYLQYYLEVWYRSTVMPKGDHKKDRYAKPKRQEDGAGRKFLDILSMRPPQRATLGAKYD